MLLAVTSEQLVRGLIVPVQRAVAAVQSRKTTSWHRGRLASRVDQNVASRLTSIKRRRPFAAPSRPAGMAKAQGMVVIASRALTVHGKMNLAAVRSRAAMHIPPGYRLGCISRTRYRQVLALWCA